VPEFYLVPKRLARKAPFLVSLAHKVEAGFFHGIFWLLRHLSMESAMGISGAAFRFLGPLGDKAQKANANLAIAFPDQSEEWRERTVREIFRHLGYSAVELVKLRQIWEEKDQRIEFVLEPKAREHVASKRPTMFISAHVGPWQVATLVTRECGYNCSLLYAPESNPIMNDLMRELRESISQDLISSEAGPRPILRELNAGNSVMLAMDTRPDTGKLVPFFGREALTNTSAVGLALRTGAAVVVARGERLPGARYRITMYDPIENPVPDAPLKDQAAAMTEVIHGHFERWIREYPEQWICLKRRWPKKHRL
jgi:KDO2-lipid IV(A) lauroyltransferase